MVLVLFLLLNSGVYLSCHALLDYDAGRLRPQAKGEARLLDYTSMHVPARLCKIPMLPPLAYKLILIQISDYTARFGYNPLGQRFLILYLKVLLLQLMKHVRRQNWNKLSGETHMPGNLQKGGDHVL